MLTTGTNRRIALAVFAAFLWLFAPVVSTWASVCPTASAENCDCCHRDTDCSKSACTVTATSSSGAVAFAENADVQTAPQLVVLQWIRETFALASSQQREIRATFVPPAEIMSFAERVLQESMPANAPPQA